MNTDEEASTRPLISSDDAHHLATDLSANLDAKDEGQLPPASEAVVLTGSTPGPQAAIETSEPVALAQVSEEASGPTTEPAADVVEHPPTPPAKDDVAAESTGAQSIEESVVVEVEEHVSHDKVDIPAPAEPTTEEEAPVEPVSSTEPEKPEGPSSEAEEVKSDEPSTLAATAQSEKEDVEEQQKDEPAPATPEPAVVATEGPVASEDTVAEHTELPPTTNVDEASEPSTTVPATHEPLDETVANGNNTGRRIS